MDDSLLIIDQDTKLLDKFQLSNKEPSPRLNANRCYGINPVPFLVANSLRMSVFFLITFINNTGHVQPNDGNSSEIYSPPSYPHECSGLIAENCLPGIISWSLLIASYLFFCRQSNLATTEKNTRQFPEKLAQTGLLSSPPTFLQQPLLKHVMTYTLAYYAVGSLLSAAAPSPSKTGYPPACNTMLSLSLFLDGSISDLPNKPLFGILGISTVLLNNVNIAFAIIAAFGRLLRSKALSKTQTEWPVNLDVSQLKKIQSTLYGLKKENLSFDTCPIYFLHNNSIPDLDPLISENNVFLAPDYVYYNTKNFIKWIKYSRSINQTSLCSPIDPSINIQFTTDDMTHLEEHINSNYGLNPSFVNFFKSTTCPITQEEIQDNAIEVNSTTTYDEEAIIEYIGHELRRDIAAESIINPETRQPISTIRYNASFTVFKDLVPENDTKKENTANGRQELANDWFIDIRKEDILHFV